MKKALSFLRLAPTLALIALINLPARAQDEVSFIPVTPQLNSNGASVNGTSDDGKRIVFHSTTDYIGENKDGNREIFLYDSDLRRIIQLTKTENIKDPADSTKTLLNVSSHTPAISGDGTRVVFISNAQLTAAANDDGNQEVFLAVIPRGSVTPTFIRLTDTGKNNDTEVVKEIFTNYTPTINSDGTLVGFASTRRQFGALENGTLPFSAALEGPNRDTPPDGNGEIFLYNLNTKLYTQVTASRDIDATVNAQVRGFNSNPNLSGDGRTLVFLSGFNYPGPDANRNADFNGEIFLYRIGDPTNSFRQLTATDTAAAVPNNGVTNLMPASTRPLNHTGTLLIFESAGNFSNQNADRTRELFLADLSGAQPAFRQITNQATADILKSDFNFFPSINAEGTFITFGSTLNLVPTNPSAITTDNGDGSRELFRYDIVNSTPEAPKFRQLTFTSPTVLPQDQRLNTIFAWPANGGNLVDFGIVAVDLAPNLGSVSEVFQAVIRPITSQNSQAATLANGASYDSTQLARGSIAAAFGTQLSNTSSGATSAFLPYEINGVTVTVGGFAAQLIFVSPNQINFVIPQAIAAAESVDFSINNNGLRSAGKVKLVNAAPGVFTLTTDGSGPAAALCLMIADGMEIYSLPPCDVGTEANPNFLILYGTGWRNAGTNITVKVGDETLTPVFAGAQPNFAGLDQINLRLTQTLKGKGEVDVIVTAAGVNARTVKISIN